VTLLSLPAKKPRVSIGAAVYNGERFLEATLDSFLQQTFKDFELIISDNGSTDRTKEICLQMAAKDSRVRYARSDRNRGAAWNHNRAAELARGEYFMWAPHDDQFAPEFLERCVAGLDQNPDVVFCHASAIDIDEVGNVLGREVHRCNCSSDLPSVRFWEQLVVHGGQNFYGLMRTAALRQIAPHQTFPWAERPLFAELSLYGKYQVVPGDLYFKRQHPGQISAIRSSPRAESIVLDPARARWWRHRTSLMLAEYVLSFFKAVQRAPLSSRERRRCYVLLVRWVLSHLPGLRLRDPRARAIEYDTSITQRLARVPW
jgi:glycosyltransferase involved in cell wall biosynthesis